MSFNEMKTAYDINWENKYRLLKEFIAEYHRFPKTKETYKGENLGSWYHDQKQMMKKADYPENRFNKMNALGTDKTTKQKEIWLQNYRLLVKFIEEYDRLPKQMEEYQGVKIGLWCARQKQRSKNSNYPAEYHQLLSETGLLDSFKWTKSQGYKYTIDRNILWDEKYELLLKFVEEHHRIPHQQDVYENVNIGQWLNYQKRLFKNPDYPTERRNKFAAIGITQEHGNPIV